MRPCPLLWPEFLLRPVGFHDTGGCIRPGACCRYRLLTSAPGLRLAKELALLTTVGGEDGVLVLRTAKVACRLTDGSGDVPLNLVGMTALCKW